MIKEIHQAIKRFITHRLFLLAVVITIMFSILINRLFILQIIEGETHLQNFTYRISKERELKSTRGNIYDRYGRVLATNELAYSISIDDSLDIKDKNRVIYDLIQIIEKNGDSVINNFPIIFNENGELEITGTENQVLRFKKDIFSRSTLTDKQAGMTDREIFEHIREKLFEIDPSYTDQEALKIMNIRFTLFMKRYAKYQREVISVDINEKTLADIKENAYDLPGVNIVQDTLRKYPDAEYFAHIIGYTGQISTQQLDELKLINEEYDANDIVGKVGIEKEMEIYLKGTKGTEKVMVNNMGKILEVRDRIEPQAGKDVYLTIDKDLQVKTYNALVKEISEVLVSKIVNYATYGSKDILIPLDDVFMALINNNIYNIKSLSDEDATPLEKSIYTKFINKKSTSISTIKEQLTGSSEKATFLLNSEVKENINYVYNLLVKKEILDTKSINKKDKEYIDWKNESISINKFLQYAISNNYIDLSKLNIDNKYYSLDEIYDAITDYVIDYLEIDQGFHKIIYSNLIKNKIVSSREWCLLLYDQGVLEDKGNDIERLTKGRISPIEFIKEKILALEITPAQLALDPCSGSAVVTDVNTGEVLALVSYPSYDNNRLVNNVDSNYYRQLLSDASYPMINRSTQQKTAPGSIFKMVSSIAGLEEGVIKPNEIIVDKGIFDKISPAAKCHAYSSGYTHGRVDVIKALETSCNYFFYELGYRLSIDKNGKYNSQIGTDTLAKYASMFGLDSKSGIELAETEPQISNEGSVRSAIGQGTNNFAPVQLAKYITTVANGGICYDLNIVDKIINKDGTTFMDKTPNIYKANNFNPQYVDLVKKGMYNVTHGASGTTRSVFKDLPIVVVGKSGTAQEDKKRPSHAVFAAYAPYDNPEISIITVIPFGYGASNAAKVVKDIVGIYYSVEEKTDSFTYDNVLH